MTAASHLLPDANIDDGVIIGYLPERPVPHDLTIGPGARLRSGTIIYAGSSIGARLQTGHSVVIREQNRLGDDVSIWSNSIVDYGCQIGHGVKIHSNCYVAQYTIIGDEAFLAPGVTFANDLVPGDEESAALMCGPTIGDRAQIGVNATILPYVTIGAGAVVGAGSVVTRDIPDDMVAYGAPAVPVHSVRESTPVRERLQADASTGGRWKLSSTSSR